MGSAPGLIHLDDSFAKDPIAESRFSLFRSIAKDCIFSHPWPQTQHGFLRLASGTFDLAVPLLTWSLLRRKLNLPMSWITREDKQCVTTIFLQKGTLFLTVETIMLQFRQITAV